MRRPSASTALLAVLALAGCGGGSSGSASPSVDGVLVVPEGTEASAMRALASRGRGASFRMTLECPAVPDGYLPLANATITYVDENGTPVGAGTTSDDCGAFSGDLPDGASGIRAEGDGFRPIEADVALFLDGSDSPGLASTIPLTAAYRIGALQSLDGNRLAFAVTDTESGRAVLGVPASAFRVSLDGADVPVASLGLAAATGASASAVLVLDASGSMSANAYTDPVTDERFDRRQLSTIAAHTFLDQKGSEDEVAAFPFSSRLFFMDQEAVDTLLPLVRIPADDTAEDVVAEDAAAESTDDENVFTTDDDGTLRYLLSDDGFVADASRLRLIVDSYDRDSDLYARGTDARHPDTPDDVLIDRSYPYSGGTAVFDAIGESVVRLAARGVGRPVVIAMTDGQDNRSERGEREVIDEAIAANVPVYTIGFGDDAEPDVLSRIADETGGSAFNVTSIDVTDAYRSIQTGIVFQYVATLENGGLGEAFTLGVSMDYAGLQAERTLTVSR